MKVNRTILLIATLTIPLLGYTLTAPSVSNLDQLREKQRAIQVKEQKEQRARQKTRNAGKTNQYRTASENITSLFDLYCQTFENREDVHPTLKELENRIENQVKELSILEKRLMGNPPFSTDMDISFDPFPTEILSEVQQVSSQIILDLEYDCALLREIIRYATISEIPYAQYEEKLERSQKLLNQASSLLRRTNIITERFMRYQTKRIKAIIPTFSSPWIDPPQTLSTKYPLRSNY